MIRISNIKINKDMTNEELINNVIIKNKINKKDILDWRISKKSIDARNKNNIYYIYSIDMILKNENKYKKLTKIKPVSIPTIKISNPDHKKVLIVGAGPSGLFSALTFIDNGIKPIIVEQGDCVENRKLAVEKFRKSGILDEYSNVQFGEGGAGTFSDGKLTSNIHSPYCKEVLKNFVKFGAPEQILYLSKPHIGTDNLLKIIKNIREYIISKGGTFMFNTQAIDFKFEDEKIKSVLCMNTITKKIQEIDVTHLVLAIGHSSRNTFKTLYKKGITIEQKNFSVGVRIEHLQVDINKSQYGINPNLKLPPAEYKLAYHSPNGHSCYTFCMCPGGVVMASSNEKNTIVTNGMSYFSRNGTNANSAVLVSISSNDLDDSSPLAGIDFQEKLEKNAFILGGSNYYAPVQRLEDFLINKKSTHIGKVKPTYLPGISLSNLNDILPNFVSQTLKEGIQDFSKKILEFSNPDSILTGLETRSSSPVRILRNENFFSNIEGIYPCGEGAGYAGGIMSAAVDGIKCAIAILKK